MKMRELVSLVLLLAGLNGCDEAPAQAVGQLLSERIEVQSEYSEIIERISVREGDLVAAGDVLLELNEDRIALRLREAEANIARISAVLAEQEAGPRTESILAARANLQESTIEREFRERELKRLAGLRQQNLTSAESVDTANKLLATASARVDMLSAQLDELLAGTRPEQVEQTRQSLEIARAQRDQLLLERERHVVRAPVSGVIDSLPLESGERPRANELAAVILTGEQPLARVYIPEPLRMQLAPGDTVVVNVDGRDDAIRGVVRNVASQASFTPYFALTERDRSRLSYVAEVELQVSGARLPDGIPVQLELPAVE